MKKVVLAVFAANAEEEQLVDFLSFGYIELLEWKKGDFAAGSEGVHFFGDQKLQLAEKVRSGLFEPIGKDGNIAGALKTGKVKVLGAMDLLKFL